MAYHVTFQIAQEYLSADDRILLYPQVEMTGELPSATNLLQSYQDWQRSYRNLDLNSRLASNREFKLPMFRSAIEFQYVRLPHNTRSSLSIVG